MVSTAAPTADLAPAEEAALFSTGWAGRFVLYFAVGTI